MNQNIDVSQPPVSAASHAAWLSTVINDPSRCHFYQVEFVNIRCANIPTQSFFLFSREEAQEVASNFKDSHPDLPVTIEYGSIGTSEALFLDGRTHPALQDWLDQHKERLAQLVKKESANV
ncbi:hypothetical protein ACLIL3_014885 [Acinetobacter radioresistens]|uniref:hypothetical protein n=1 Tax=Acinetobacter radioresistens TaxID=40216 RepID=UPI003984BFD4